MHSIISDLKRCYGKRAFSFYGRSPRSEFFTVLASSVLLMLAATQLSLLPVAGALLQAVLYILLFMVQLSALIRRLHDLDRRGHLAALPYLAGIAYFIARMPVHALYPDSADLIMTVMLLVAASTILWVLFLCCKKGTAGDNRFGTDPLDASVRQQDFINPEHLQSPEYLGDPWRKFKAKHGARQDDARQDDADTHARAHATGSAADDETLSPAEDPSRATAESSTTTNPERLDADPADRK